MRIISNFHDYYDSAMSYGHDETIIYKRKTEELSDNKISKILKKDSWDDRWHLDEFMVVVGKKYFLGKIAIIKIDGISQFFDYFYDAESLDNFYKKHLKKEEYEEYIKEGKGWSISDKNYSRKMEDEKYFEQKFPILENFCIENKIPIVVFKKDSANNAIKILSPKLSDYKFFKVMQPNILFQEIDMFISGVLGTKMVPMITVKEEVRLEKRGFDKKTSFRKAPTKRRIK